MLTRQSEEHIHAYLVVNDNYANRSHKANKQMKKLTARNRMSHTRHRSVKSYPNHIVSVTGDSLTKGVRGGRRQVHAHIVYDVAGIYLRIYRQYMYKRDMVIIKMW